MKFFRKILAVVTIIVFVSLFFEKGHYAADCRNGYHIHDSALLLTQEERAHLTPAVISLWKEHRKATYLVTNPSKCDVRKELWQIVYRHGASKKNLRIYYAELNEEGCFDLFRIHLENQRRIGSEMVYRNLGSFENRSGALFNEILSDVSSYQEWLDMHRSIESGIWRALPLATLVLSLLGSPIALYFVFQKKRAALS